ncbi:hypothetical protein GGI42DRAFT_326215 [Trichoderma sp. SZMC 28013]
MVCVLVALCCFCSTGMRSSHHECNHHKCMTMYLMDSLSLSSFGLEWRFISTIEAWILWLRLSTLRSWDSIIRRSLFFRTSLDTPCPRERERYLEKDPSTLKETSISITCSELLWG